jgi:hypothetical protein
MGTLLTRRRPAAVFAATLAAASASASASAFAESDRHELYFDVSGGYVSASTDLTSWTEGGFSKLRYAEDGVEAYRLFGEYSGRITPTLRVRVVADYVEDASGGLDLTEAVVDWRPIPRSRNQHQLRFGAFYPSFSLENGDRGWQSPFTYSYSAINTWLGEEIRPIGAEWSVRRRLAGFHSNHEVRAFAAGFYGNDPAGTLLFWRGWGLHDRQSRLDDELTIPPLPFTTQPQKLTPFMETDHRPGGYAGVEWRYARRALVQLAHYDNRADPFSFRDRQWGWSTRFDHLAVQVGLPAGLGLVVQSLSGTTEWLTAALPNGTRLPMSEHVRDELESTFVLLTRKLGANQRLALRYDTFSIERPAAVPVLHADDGHAWTLSYRLEASERFSGGIEWLRIDSRRDLLPLFYATAPAHSETQVRLQFSYRLSAPAR